VQNKAQSQANAHDKAISVGGRNYVEVWGRSPHQPPEVNGGSGAELSTLWRLYGFFSNTHTFLGIFWSKFMRKNTFLND